MAMMTLTWPWQLFRPMSQCCWAMAMALSSAIGYLNGDGDQDLAVGSYHDHVSVLLGNGDGSFQSAVNYGAGPESHSVAIGDLDGDSDQDLAVSNYQSKNVSVLLGNGDGTFQPTVNYGAGQGPHSVAIGDLDGDGNPDLAVASTLDHNVSVLLGNGDGSFQSPENYGADAYPLSLAIGDLNGDDAPDLAVAGGDNVSVLINTGWYQEISVDIKPGNGPNSINCNNEKGVITVAILTTDDFDATTVDHTSVAFAEAGETHVNKKSGELRRHEEDVDGDGDPDLVFHFRFGETEFTCDSIEGTLTGETFAGQAIEGSDAIRMVVGEGA
jgi:hypothetical protein